MRVEFVSPYRHDPQTGIGRYLHTEELPLLFGAADVYVTASWLEEFGFPVLEAMACGTSVACSSAGALLEVVGDTALLIRQSRADALLPTSLGTAPSPYRYRILVPRMCEILVRTLSCR